MESFCIECQEITKCVLLKYRIKHKPPPAPKLKRRYVKSTQCNTCKVKTASYEPVSD